MAIIKKRSKHWTAIFRDGQGKQVWRVLSGITNKREAKAAADMLEDAAQRRRNGARLKRTFNEFYKQSYGEASCGASSLRDFVTTWLKQKQREVSASTLEAYTKATGTLIDFMGARADGDISEISKRDLLAFREHLLSTGRGSTTVNKYVCQLKLLFKDAQKDEYTIDNAATFLESVKGDGMKRHPFSVAEIRVILDAASPEWRSLVMFGIYTGQRLGDLARLTWANIDTARGEIRLTTQKTKKRMPTPIAEPLMNQISN